MNLTTQQKEKLALAIAITIILSLFIYTILTFDSRVEKYKIEITKEIGSFESKENIDSYSKEKASIILEPYANLKIFKAKFDFIILEIHKLEKECTEKQKGGLNDTR